MRALDRKLFRDLWQIKGQGLAIALVIASGISIFVTYLSNADSLRLSMEIYYDRQRMADVFASAKRAPLSLVREIEEIPGVARVEARVVVDVTLDVPGLEDPAVGRIVSIPVPDEDTLNDIVLREGRYPGLGRVDEVVITEAFGAANDLRPGDSVSAVINGRRRELQIVGVGLSPEYVYGIRPGDILPDDQRFGVLWMGREGLANAFQMDGAFNDVVVRLVPGVSEDEVIARLDDLLDPYGGLGAIPRRLQVSNWYVENELKQLENVGLVIPLIFLGVAVFLLNVVLNRIVSVQRSQIAALKALGYSNLSVGVHYGRLAVLVGLGGAVIGVGGGAWLGRELLGLYNEFFRFPVLEYRLEAELVFGGLAVSVVGAVLGALGAVASATRLPPAEAMRPAPPATYRPTVVERLGLADWLSPPARMVLRNVERRPGRTAISCLGIGMAAAIMVAGMFMFDSIDYIMEQQFTLAQRQDVTVTLVEPRGPEGLHEMERLPGTSVVEPFRSVPVHLGSGHRSRRTAVTGLVAEPSLNRVVAPSGDAIPLPAEGLMLSRALAEILGVREGDRVRMEVLVGRRPRLDVPVTRIVTEYLGTSAYMEIGALRRILGEGATLSGAFLSVESGSEASLYDTLERIPAVAGVGLKSAAIEGFEQSVTEFLGVMLFFNLMFGGIIAFGVIYNSARVALSERSRELGSLRVLGFTRQEIATILLGELGTVTAVAIPLGLAMGWGLAAVATVAFESELFRIPLVIAPRTYALAAATVVVASVVSGWVVRGKLYRLDLVAVLKTRE